MISKFVEAFMRNKETMRRHFCESFPKNYLDIVKEVVRAVVDYQNDDNHTYGSPDPNMITEIDDGNYQGTLVYVIPENTYQPDRYWYVRISYGSCAGCDTLERIICFYGDCSGTPTEEQLDDVMTLALHVVQGLREMEGDCV